MYTSASCYNGLTKSFWLYPGDLPWIHDPVVVFECVHGLKDGGDAPHVGVDLRIREELRGKVGVQLGLDARRGVQPETRVEETVVQKLLQEKVGVVGRTGHEEFGQLEVGGKIQNSKSQFFF